MSVKSGYLPRFPSAFTATYGIYSGYGEPAYTLSPGTAEEEFRRHCRLAMEEVRITHGKIISVVVHPSRVIYPENLGGPRDGEYAMTVHGCMNPVFDGHDFDGWKDAVIEFTVKLKKLSKQTTVRIEWYAAGVTYIKDDET